MVKWRDRKAEAGRNSDGQMELQLFQRSQHTAIIQELNNAQNLKELKNFIKMVTNTHARVNDNDDDESCSKCLLKRVHSMSGARYVSFAEIK